LPVNDQPVIGQKDGSVVEENVMIRTKTQHITDVVGSVSVPTEWNQVRAFCVGAAQCFQSHPADLASEVVEIFNVRWDLGISYETKVCGQAARSRAHSRVRLCDVRRNLVSKSKSVPANEWSTARTGQEGILDDEKTSVFELTGGRTNYANWKKALNVLS
jgi:hypothetical protein